MLGTDETGEEQYGLSQDNLELIQACLDELLTGKMYDESKSAQMINDILEKVMEVLYKLKKPYKYIVDCMLSHRVGSYITNYTSAHYDKVMDNCYHVFYPKEKTYVAGKDKALIFAMVTIFVVSYFKA